MTFNPFTLYHLIETHGQTITYTRVSTEPTYDPATGTNTGGATTSYTLKGYFYNYDLSELSNGNVTLGDRKLLIKPTDTSGVTIPEPQVADTFLGTGDTVSLKGVTKIYSGTNLLCYICQVRE